MDRLPANPLTPGSTFMVDMDSVLRHAESFSKGQVSTQTVRNLILQCQTQTASPRSTITRDASQADQLRSALHALQKIADGESAPEKFAAVAINHISCGQYVPETAAPDLRAFGLKVGYEVGGFVDPADPLPDVEKIVETMLMDAPIPFRCQYDSERTAPSLDCRCGACTDQA